MVFGARGFELGAARRGQSAPGASRRRVRIGGRGREFEFGIGMEYSLDDGVVVSSIEESSAVS